MCLTLDDTDVSLMELLDGFGFEAKTFDTAAHPGILLVGFKRTDNVRIAEKVVIDNPVSDRCEGLVGRIEYRRTDTARLSPPFNWVRIIWTYIGNGHDEPEAGSCGSVIWNEVGGSSNIPIRR